MEVREKLVELLKTNACPFPFMCDQSCRYYSYGACFPDRFADHLISNGVMVQEWISVKDGVPKNSGHYLVVHRNKHDGSTSTAIAAYIKCKIGEWWANDETYNVTYWMPLPEMPKENDYETD